MNIYYGEDFSTSSLKHHGVKGMKCGVRRTPEQLGRRTLNRGTKVYRGDKNLDNVKNKYSVNDVDRAREKKNNAVMDSIHIFDPDTLTKVLSKPIGSFESYKSKKLYDEWMKYIN